MKHVWDVFMEFETSEGPVAVYKCVLCGAPSVDDKKSRLWDTCESYKLWFNKKKSEN